jgi:hypothetical protein
MKKILFCLALLSSSSLEAGKTLEEARLAMKADKREMTAEEKKIYDDYLERCVNWLLDADLGCTCGPDFDRALRVHELGMNEVKRHRANLEAESLEEKVVLEKHGYLVLLAPEERRARTKELSNVEADLKGMTAEEKEIYNEHWMNSHAHIVFGMGPGPHTADQGIPLIMHRYGMDGVKAHRASLEAAKTPEEAK